MLVIALMEVPFTMVKKIEKLKFMAFIGVGGILLFMTTFVVHYIIAVADKDANNDPLGEMNEFPEDWFQAAAVIPNIILALSYQMNFFPVFKGMRNASDKKMKAAALTGVGVCAASYLLVGILGYSLVGGDAKANFLESLKY